jgi:hypothetical protein
MFQVKQQFRGGPRYRVVNETCPTRYVAQFDTRHEAQVFIDQIPAGRAIPLAQTVRVIGICAQCDAEIMATYDPNGTTVFNWYHRETGKEQCES